MNKKLILGIAIAVVIAGIYIAINYNQPCIDDCDGHTRVIKTDNNPVVTGWKTYSGEKIGFSFLYPANYTVRNLDSSIVFSDGPSAVLIIESKIYHEKDPSKPAKISELDFSGMNAKHILIDGKDVVRYDSTQDSSGLYLYQDSNGNIVTLETNATLLDNIIPTIKFSSSTPASVLNWKTYTNAKYGFEVKYPNNFSIDERNDASFFNEQHIFELVIKPLAGYEQGTDYYIASLNIFVSPATDKCYTSSPTSELLTAVKVINGASFHYDPKQPFLDDAMGGVRGLDYLFTNNMEMSGHCFRIEKMLAYRDPHGFTDPPYPPHYNAQKVNGDLDAIMETFKFTNKSSN